MEAADLLAKSSPSLSESSRRTGCDFVLHPEEREDFGGWAQRPR